MKKDKCPDCGANQDPDYPTTHYGCGQPIRPIKGIYRACECYERELAALKGLEKEMGDRTERSRKALVCFMDNILIDDISLMDDLNEILSRSEIVKIMEGK